MLYKKKTFIIIIFFLSLLIIYKNKIYANNIIKKKIINKKNKQYIYIKNNVFLIKINKKNNKIENILFNYYKNKNKNSYLFKKIIKNNFLNIKIKKIHKKKYKTINLKIKKKIFLKNKIILLSYINNKKNINIYNKIIINKDSYNILIDYIIQNKSKKKINIIYKNKLAKFKKENNNEYKEQNISYLDNKKYFYKYNINEINKNILIKKKINWISIYEKYFIYTLIPINKKNNNINIKKNNNILTINLINKYTLNKNQKKKIKLKLWIGPKLNNLNNLVSDNLDLTIDYGLLSFISKPLFLLLSNINKITNNWGYSIIILTIILKLLTYPLNKKQHESFILIKKIQKKIKKIKKKYKKNKNKINNKIINLYKKYNINIFKDIILLLIQIPIFISVYNILTIPIELQESNFIFWINDLSSYDKYYILPIIMGISIYILQTNNLKKKNNNINIIFPILISIFLINFPSGLLISYITNNLITIMQQKNK